jgi:hypothetical protein
VSPLNFFLYYLSKFLFSNLDALNEDQACIVVTHWEEEVPWGEADGIQKYVLQDGCGQVV